jgi:hypothetical protein
MVHRVYEQKRLNGKSTEPAYMQGTSALNPNL